jgi:hypothetical protein
MVSVHFVHLFSFPGTWMNVIAGSQARDRSLANPGSRSSSTRSRLSPA